AHSDEIVRSRRLCQCADRVRRDHLLLVRGDDVDTDAARLCSDLHLSSSIGVLVEDNAQPGTACTDTRPYFRCVLADSRCEYEAVEAIQGGGQGADLARGAKYEQLYSLARVRIVAGEQRGAVACKSGYAEETAAAVEHVLVRVGAHAMFAHEVGPVARIESSVPTAPDQPVKCGDAPGGFQATSIIHRTEARA